MPQKNDGIRSGSYPYVLVEEIGKVFDFSTTAEHRHLMTGLCRRVGTEFKIFIAK